MQNFDCTGSAPLTTALFKGRLYKHVCGVYVFYVHLASRGSAILFGARLTLEAQCVPHKFLPVAQSIITPAGTGDL